MKTMKEILAKNLKNEMDTRNITQTDLAKYLGCSISTVNTWVQGRFYPRDTQVEKMAKLFNIPPSKLVVDNDPIRVPVLGAVRAGYPALAQQEVLDYEEITPEMANMGKIFGLKIKGDSMMPEMAEGDVVLVLEQSDVESGDIAVVMVGSEDATIKRVIKGADSITLIPFNPAYTPMTFSAEECNKLPVRIIGKAVELRRKI